MAKSLADEGKTDWQNHGWQNDKPINDSSASQEHIEIKKSLEKETSELKAQADRLAEEIEEPTGKKPGSIT